MGSLVSAAQTAYQGWKDSNPASIEDWQGMTDAEIAGLFRQDQMYQQAIRDAQSIEESFYAARVQAFADLETSQVSERAALQSAWQAKENADYDVDFET